MSYTENPHGALGRDRAGRSDRLQRATLDRWGGTPVALLQLLTQAKKMGKETISSQELSDYTRINSTRSAATCRASGKFGKRGVGYNVGRSSRRSQDPARTAGQHNIALLGAGHLGQAIASSDIFADHGFGSWRSSTSTTKRSGRTSATRSCATPASCARWCRRRTSSSACSRCPRPPPGLADDLVGWARIIFNYSDVAAQVPPEVTVHHVQPSGRPLRSALSDFYARPDRHGLGRRAQNPNAQTP